MKIQLKMELFFFLKKREFCEITKKKIKFILAEILTVYYKHFKYYIIFKL